MKDHCVAKSFHDTSYAALLDLSKTKGMSLAGINWWVAYKGRVNVAFSRFVFQQAAA